MSRRSRVLSVVVGALLLSALAWWVWRPRAQKVASPAVPSPAVTERATQPRLNAAPKSVAPPVTPPAAAPTPPERPTRHEPAEPLTRIDLAPPPAKAHDSSYVVPLPNTMLRDRRDHPGPHAQRERVAVGYALDTLDEDIQACLDQWRKTQVSLNGSLMLSIEIDAHGVQKAWVETDAGLPLGPESCFANAVYGIDWSHMVDSPAKITRPYSFDGEGGI